MKKLLISLLILATAATGIFFYSKSSKEPTTNDDTNTQTPDPQTADATENTTDTTDETTEERTCNTSQMFTPPADAEDLSKIKFYIATSKDGVTFDDSKVFLEGGGVPSVTAGPNNQVLAVFNWFTNYSEDPICYNKVGAKISNDGGKTWSDPHGIYVENFPSDYQVPFDPTITTTEDGTYRLFFTTHELGMTAPLIYGSATSTDGLTYTYEEGTRFSSSKSDIVDGSEVRVGNTWYMIAPMAKQNGKALDAESTDGKTFTEVTSDRNADIYWVGNMVNVNGTVRFYGSCLKKQGALCFSSTKDGKLWGAAMPTNMSNADPGIAYTEDGTYILIYPEPKNMFMPEDSNTKDRR